MEYREELKKEVVDFCAQNPRTPYYKVGIIYKLGVDTIKKWCEESGVYPPNIEEEVVNYYMKTNDSFRSIGLKFAISADTVKKYLLKREIPIPAKEEVIKEPTLRDELYEIRLALAQEGITEEKRQSLEDRLEIVKKAYARELMKKQEEGGKLL